MCHYNFSFADSCLDHEDNKVKLDKKDPTCLSNISLPAEQAVFDYVPHLFEV